MPETCRGGPRPIRLCVEKTKNFGQIQPPRTWIPKWNQILIGPFSQNLKPIEQRTYATCLELAGEALGLLGCVLKRLKILLKFNTADLEAKMDPNFDSANLKPIEQRACPTCLKLAGEAIGLLGCVLKRLKILVNFNHRRPGGQNGHKF